MSPPSAGAIADGCRTWASRGRADRTPDPTRASSRSSRSLTAPRFPAHRVPQRRVGAVDAAAGADAAGAPAVVVVKKAAHPRPVAAPAAAAAAAPRTPRAPAVSTTTI